MKNNQKLVHGEKFTRDLCRESTILRNSAFGKGMAQNKGEFQRIGIDGKFFQDQLDALS